jgi:opacity protein-like surface antigen
MRKSVIVAALLLMAAGTVAAQDFPKVETSPAFMYIRTAPVGGGTQDFNCAGGGGTFAYNLSSMLGIAADMDACKIFSLSNAYGIGTQVSGSQFTYLFGPRLTLRNSSKFTPFFEASFGGDHLSLKCNSNSTCAGATFSANAFAMAVGGGFDIKLTSKISLRPVQAEYWYTRFGNDCSFEECNGNNNQNSFRLKSGIVINWGGSK